MSFKKFILDGKIKKAIPDKMLIKSLLQNAEKDLIFLSKIKIDGYSSRKIMANYYDVLRSILEAVALIDGYKIYSHEPFTYFLKEKRENLLSIKFDRFRKIRNKVNYYGYDISIDETKENIKEIKQTINIIKEKYLKQI